MSQDSKNRQQPPMATLNQVVSSDKALYKPIQGDYETRILEIKAGSGNETLRGAPHHCLLDGDRLELSSLRTRTLGQTFQEFRTGLRRALKNRRLGITSEGYLGLFPGHVKKGDVVYVFETCALPSTLRSAGNGKFRFISECYVYGIMEGEAVEAEDTCRIDVTLV